MSWWGKIIGGTFGFMLGGPLGALLGASFGHNFDKGSQGGHYGGSRRFQQQERVQSAFFTATFSVMGHMCKADGKVTENELSLARQVMAQMDLNPDQKKVAMSLFNEGKKDSFPVSDVLQQLRQEIGFRPNLQKMFIEIQLYTAYADGVMHPSEKKILLKICQVFKISQAQFNQMAAAIAGEVHHRQSGAQGRSSGITMKDAYAILSVNKDTSDAEIKKSYRRLMSQHHPDKLVSKGLPEEMIKVAEQRTHEIRTAYEKIKEARGMK
jgi:DnaJ like chaperone protein